MLGSLQHSVKRGVASGGGLSVCDLFSDRLRKLGCLHWVNYVGFANSARGPLILREPT